MNFLKLSRKKYARFSEKKYMIHVKNPSETLELFSKLFNITHIEILKVKH